MITKYGGGGSSVEPHVDIGASVERDQNQGQSDYQLAWIKYLADNIGSGLPASPSTGDEVYWDGSAWVSLSGGAVGSFRSSNGTIPNWVPMGALYDGATDGNIMTWDATNKWVSESISSAMNLSGSGNQFVTWDGTSFGVETYAIYSYGGKTYFVEPY